MQNDQVTGEKQVSRDANGRFVKGASGNPSGRPKESKKENYRALLDAVCTNSAWIAIIKRAVRDAKKGDRWARAWLSSYDWGPPKQGIIVEGNIGFTLADWEQRAEERMREAMEGEPYDKDTGIHQAEQDRDAVL